MDLATVHIGIEQKCGTTGLGVIQVGILGCLLIDGHHLDMIDGDIITTGGITTGGITTMGGTIGTIILIIIEEVAQRILMDVGILT